MGGGGWVVGGGLWMQDVSLFQHVLCLAYILHATFVTCDEVYDVSGVTG